MGHLLNKQTKKTPDKRRHLIALCRGSGRASPLYFSLSFRADVLNGFRGGEGRHVDWTGSYFLRPELFFLSHHVISASDQLSIFHALALTRSVLPFGHSICLLFLNFSQLHPPLTPGPADSLLFSSLSLSFFFSLCPGRHSHSASYCET